jgi:hypothetical protein
MKALSHRDFAESVLAMAGLHGPFTPSATYIPEGDCVEFVFAPDDYYGERIDGLVTVYYSRKTGEIIGSLLKGIRAFFGKVTQSCPGFAIEIKAGRVRLEHIFLARLWTQEKSSEIVVRKYQKLIEAAKETNIEVDLPESATAPG